MDDMHAIIKKFQLMKCFFILSLVSCLIAGFFYSHPLFAQEVQSPDDSARGQFEAGTSFVAQKKYQAALDAFLKSYALNPKPIVLFNIGMCHKALFQFGPGIEAFEKFIVAIKADLQKGKKNAAEFERQAKLAIEEMSNLVGKLFVKNAPEGALLKIDNEPKGQVSEQSPFYLPPGRYKLEIVFQSNSLLTTYVTIVAGVKIDVHVSDETASEKPPVAMKDSAKQETADVTKVFKIDADQTNVKPMPAARNGKKIVGITLVVTGSAAAVLGVVFTIKGAVDHSNAEAFESKWNTDGDLEAAEEYNKIRNDVLPMDKKLMAVGYISAGIFVGIGTVVLLLDKKDRQSKKIAFTPSVNGLTMRF